MFLLRDSALISTAFSVVEKFCFYWLNRSLSYVAHVFYQGSIDAHKFLSGQLYINMHCYTRFKAVYYLIPIQQFLFIHYLPYD